MQQSWLALTKYKVSAEAGNELAGVTFDLYKQNGDQPDTAADTKLNTEAMTTDAEGVITYAGLTTDENGVGTNTEALKRGWYTLTELSAPGYVRTGSDDQLFSCHFEVKNVRSTDADGKTTEYE